MRLRTIDEIEAPEGKRVLLRLCLNVPIHDGAIADAFRIDKVLPTLKKLIELGTRVTIVSHFKEKKPIEDYLRAQVRGDFEMRDNLRDDAREEVNDTDFARELAEGHDVFVNEDFPVSHREHASVVGLPKYLPSYVGYQFAAEVGHLSNFLNPPEPCVVILGGAKLETKLPMIEAFLPKADKIFLGSYFAKAVRTGYPFGYPVPKREKVVFPTDVVEKNGEILDVGPRALEAMKEAVAGTASVIWNGPLGYFEGGYSASTEELAAAIASSKAESVVGGGDSISAIKKLNLLDKFTFVSTGGGAMLDFLAHGTLAGVEAILASSA